MLNKIYIHIDNLPTADKKEISTYSFLRNEMDSNEIWNNYIIRDRKIPDNKKHLISVEVLELYLFINYLKNKWYSDSQIELVNDKSLLLYNDDLYKIENWTYLKMDIKKVWFFSMRWQWWNNPFFYLLKSVIEGKWWKMKRTNDIKRNLQWKCKFYALNSLYKKRKQLIWDIVVPYKIKQKDYNIVVSFLIEKLWWKVVVKKDMTIAWEGVFITNLLDYDSIQRNKFESVMKTHMQLWRELYIVPFEKFKEEYRIYFTKLDWKIIAHSLKRKNILSSDEEIFKADSFKYYKNIKLEWSYIENKDWEWKYKNIIKISKKYLKNLDFTTGTLEFWETLDWRLIFFEVNSMSAALCYDWEDVWNMTRYYHTLFKNFLS